MRRRSWYVSAALFLASSAAHGDASVGGQISSRRTAPTPAIADPVSCQTQRLRFQPTPGTRYAISTWDQADRPREPRAAYGSTLVFSRRSPQGWVAVESDFRRPFISAAASGLSDARLEWQLDEHGVPVADPAVSGGGDPVVVRNLSLFAFRPVGLVAGSVCAGATGESSFTDAAHRTRSYAFSVASSDGPSVVLKVRGSVQIPTGSRWQQVGEIRVELADGLAGEAQLHESSSQAPATQRERVVVIARQPSAPPKELHIAATKEGALYCEGVATDLAGLRATARTAVAGDKDVRVILAADERLAHSKVVELLDALKAEGVSKFALAVSAGSSHQ